MAQNKTQWIQHQLAGGWATDWGPIAHTAPDQNGIVKVPWLNTARNLVYELDGGVHKMPGTQPVNGNNNELEDFAEVMGIYDYWRQGVSASPTQRRVIHVGTKIKADTADGDFQDIATDFVDGAIPHYETFDDLLIIASDAVANVPKSWDQTTFQSLAGSPPRFSFSCSHKNRMWAAGDFTNPSRLYYSVNLNPEDWIGTGSGSIDITPSDGDMITGIYSFKDQLWIFKGPHKGSIHRLSGSSASDFTLAPFTKGVGANWQHGIFPLPNDLGFVSPRGTIHSLVAVQEYGDYQRSALSFPINRHLQKNLNHSRQRYWRTATDIDEGYTLIAITPSGQTRNTQLLHMDFRFQTLGEQFPRWALWDTFGAAALAPVIDIGNRLNIWVGERGYVYRTECEDRTHNQGFGASGINFQAQTPFMDYGSEQVMKTIYTVGINISPKNQNSIVFRWLRDGQAAQEAFVTQGGSDPLGVWTDPQFTLDTSVLGGTRYLPRYIELEEGGEFRAIQYTIETAGGAGNDLELHGLTCAIAGSGVSTENE